MSGRRLRPEEDRRIARAYLAGSSSVDLAAATGLSSQTILRSLQRSGVERRQPAQAKALADIERREAEMAELRLEGGEWKRRRGIQVWVPTRKAAEPMLVCRVCGATEDESCRYPNGRSVARHKKGWIEWRESA